MLNFSPKFFADLRVAVQSLGNQQCTDEIEKEIRLVEGCLYASKNEKLCVLSDLNQKIIKIGQHYFSGWLETRIPHIITEKINEMYSEGLAFPSVLPDFYPRSFGALPSNLTAVDSGRFAQLPVQFSGRPIAPTTNLPSLDAGVFFQTLLSKVNELNDFGFDVRGMVRVVQEAQRREIAVEAHRTWLQEIMPSLTLELRDEAWKVGLDITQTEVQQELEQWASKIEKAERMRIGQMDRGTSFANDRPLLSALRQGVQGGASISEEPGEEIPLVMIPPQFFDALSTEVPKLAAFGVDTEKMASIIAKVQETPRNSAKECRHALYLLWGDLYQIAGEADVDLDDTSLSDVFRPYISKAKQRLQKEGTLSRTIAATFPVFSPEKAAPAQPVAASTAPVQQKGQLTSLVLDDEVAVGETISLSQISTQFFDALSKAVSQLTAFGVDTARMEQSIAKVKATPRNSTKEFQNALYVLWVELCQIAGERVLGGTPLPALFEPHISEVRRRLQQESALSRTIVTASHVVDDEGAAV